MHVLAEGQAEYLRVDPDGFRAYVRDHKQRALVPKLMSARDAIERYVADGDTPPVLETFAAMARDILADYVAKYVTPFADDAEMFDKLIGPERLEKLRANEPIHDGYRA